MLEENVAGKYRDCSFVECVGGRGGGSLVKLRNCVRIKTGS